MTRPSPLSASVLLVALGAVLASCGPARVSMSTPEEPEPAASRPEATVVETPVDPRTLVDDRIVAVFSQPPPAAKIGIGRLSWDEHWDPARIKALRVVGGAEGLEVTGRAPDNEFVAQLLIRLDGAGPFQRVLLRSVRAVDPIVEFEIGMHCARDLAPDSCDDLAIEEAWKSQVAANPPVPDRPPTAEANIDASALRLGAIVSGAGGRRRAMVTDQNGVGHIVAVGNRIGGAEVTSLSDSELELTLPDGSVRRLSLRPQLLRP